MKRILLFTLAAVSVLTTLCWCRAQVKARIETRPATTNDSYIALHQLELLVARLEATKDTNTSKLVWDFNNVQEGQRLSGEIGINTQIILRLLREGRTQEVIEWQEKKLEHDLVSLSSHYEELSPTVREKFNPCTSVQMARDYFAKYPRTKQSDIVKQGLARAFELFPAKVK